MNNKTGKVIWFTFKQVVTSNWFCLISVLGLVCVFLSTQIDKIIGAIWNNSKYFRTGKRHIIGA